MKAAKDNPQLDVCSAHFNPAVALHDSAALKYLPLKVKPLDSIQQCRFLLPPSDPNYKALKKRRVNVSPLNRAPDMLSSHFMTLCDSRRSIPGLPLLKKRGAQK